MNKEINK